MSSTEGFVVTLVTNAAIAVVVAVVFTIVRPLFKQDYQPRCYQKDNPPPEPKGGPFGWIISTLTYSHEDLLKTSGADALTYVMFLETAIVLLGALTVLGIGAVLPLNYSGPNKDLDSSDPEYAKNLDVLTMANLEQESSKFWLHWVFTFLYSALVYYIVYKRTTQFVQIRQQFLKKKMLSHYTVIVSDLPDNTTKKDLETHFKKLYPESELYAVIAPNAPKLVKLVQDREQMVRKLESATAKCAKDKKHTRPTHKTKACGCCGEKVDSIEFYTKEIERLDKRIAEKREKYSADADRKHWSNAGFVTFSSMANAAKCAQSLVSPHVSQYLVHVAPEPQTVLWASFGLQYKQRIIRRVLVEAAYGALIVFGAIPIAFATSLANIDNLADISALSFLQDVANLNPVVKGIIQGILPPVVIVVIMILLLLLLDLLERQTGPFSLTAVNHGVMKRFLLWQVINVFVISIISGSVWTALNSIIDDPTSIIRLLASSMPKQSTYFISYILVLGMGTMLNILRIGPFIVSRIKAKFLAGTEREIREAKAPGPLEYHTVYANNLLIFVIVLGYSLMSPLILPFGVIYFATNLLVHKYGLIYVYDAPHEGGGEMFVTAMNSMMSALLLFQLATLGIMLLKVFPAAAALAILLVITPLFWGMIKHIYDRPRFFLALNDCPEFEEVTDAVKPSSSDIEMQQQQPMLSEVPWAEHKNAYLHPALKKDIDLVPELVPITA